MIIRPGWMFTRAMGVQDDLLAQLAIDWRVRTAITNPGRRTAAAIEGRIYFLGNLDGNLKFDGGEYEESAGSVSISGGIGGLALISILV